MVYKNRENSFEDDWKDASEYIDKAIEKLENLKHNGFGVRSKKDIPFAPTIPIIAAILKKIDSRNDKSECYKKMKQWYWSAVFSNAYSSAVESQLTLDFKQIIKWFDNDNEVPETVITARRGLGLLDLKNIRTKSNSMYKGVMSILAIEGSKDFDTGQSLEHTRENDKDHLLTRAGSYEYGLQKYVDSVVNMAWLSNTTNRGIKSAKTPSKYIEKFIKEKYNGNEKEFTEILKTHLINKKTYRSMLNNDFGEFIGKREETILHNIASFIGLPKELSIRLEDNKNEVIDTLEENLRNLINNQLQEVSEKDYWKHSIPGDIKQEVKKKVEERLKRFPNESIEDYDEGYELIIFCNIMDYMKIILKNWDYFKDIFKSKQELEKHFKHFNDFRNAIKHGREMNNIERKQGEASMEWLEYTLKGTTNG